MLNQLIKMIFTSSGTPLYVMLKKSNISSGGSIVKINAPIIGINKSFNNFVFSLKDYIYGFP